MHEQAHSHGRRLNDLIADASEAASSPLDVAAIRRRLKFTQAQFAGYFGFPVATLRHWERGNRRPTGTALVLLHVIASHPRAVLTAVRKARRETPGLMAEMERSRSHRAPPGEAVYVG